MSSNEVIAALMSVLGEDIVSLGEGIAERRTEDWSGLRGEVPLALARPRSVAQVSEIMSICNHHRQPVVVQGGLTGLAGGACTSRGDIALSLERMNAIGAVDTISGTVTVEAGATLEAVQQAAEAAGLMFALDLGARGSCTIGGNLATNAGGVRVIRYGMAREHVLDVEAVLADGSVIGGLHRMVKNNTGYDLRNLMIGSEGTLGVITRAVLRLRPRPGAVATAWCGLADYAAVTRLLECAQRDLEAGVSAFEVMWPSFVDYVTGSVAGLRRPLGSRHGYYVLLEATGSQACAHQERFEGFLATMLENGVIENAAIAQSRADAQMFWRVRDSTADFPVTLPGLVAFDVSFSIADIGAAAQLCEREVSATWPGSIVLAYGHLGDGNLHLIVHVADADAQTVEDIEVLVYGIVRDFGGSVSAEHGIGAKKRDVLDHTRSADEIAAMHSIKRALDPFGVLNPRKVLPG
ncbi:MAG: FAD-binding oxidoreductase [Paraburkholderia sp.]|jgi:FAD/FMN-containing dehydrogenase|nr:FAD-binding oxidoreductase [Paraburkholderia sp.]